MQSEEKVLKGSRAIAANTRPSPVSDGGLPKNQQDATVLLEVDGATWREIFNATGEPQRLDGEELTWDRIRKSFQDQPPGEELAKVLELLHVLGTDEGRDLIEQAAADRQVQLDGIKDLPARQFAAQLWLQSRSNVAIQEVLKRAQINAFEISKSRTYREFAPNTDIELPKFDLAQMTAAVERWYRDNQDVSDANAFPCVDISSYERNGEWYCEIIKGGPRKRVAQVIENRKKLSLLEFEPAASDLLRFDPKTGRIGIATRSSNLLKTYRKLLGKFVAANEDFFSNENVCSLKELQDQGAELFKRRFSGIAAVTVVQFSWRSDDKGAVWVRGRDCFKTLKDLGVQDLRMGELFEAKLSVAFADGSRSGQVWLKVPHTIEINAGTHEAIVEQMLDEVGIRGVFDDKGDRKNFWSRSWRMSEAAFRRLLPDDDFDRLRREKIILPVNLESVPHPDHPEAGNALRVVELGNAVVGVSDDSAIPLRTLTSSDIAGFELKIDALARSIAEALQLEAGCNELGPSGLWSLGRRALGPVTISVFLATKPTDPTTTPMLMQSASSNARPVLLVPACCSCSIPNAVACRMPQGPLNSVLAKIVEQLQLHGQIDPLLVYSDDLIVQASKGQMWLKRVSLSKLEPNTHPFKFLALLAEAPGSIISKRSLNEALSSSRDDDEAAKHAKRSAVKAIKDSFAAAGVDAPDLNKIIVQRGDGYALYATGRVIP